MTATIHDVLVNGETASETATGFTVQRKVMISNLVYGTYARGGGPIITVDNLIPVALDALDYYYSGRYAIGAQHPGIPAQCYLRERSPRAVSKDIVEVTLSYESFLMSYAKMSFNGGVEGVECNRGWARTTASFESGDAAYASSKEDMYVLNKSSTKEGCSTNANITIVQIIAEQDELISEDALIEKIMLNTGRLNSSIFFGRVPGFVYCQEIHADRIYAFQYGPDKTDMGYYNVRYVFSCRLTPTNLHWDSEVVYTDPETGRPIDPSVVGSQRKRYRVYGTTDFNALGIRGIRAPRQTK
jgi:hypothetical protein